MGTPRIRVAVYVVRGVPAAPELLVFDHRGMPEAGTQVPAGGVDPGESTAEAALRELAEETGLTAARIVRELGVEERPHPETGAPRRTTFVLAEPTAPCPDAWAHAVTAGDGGGGLVFECRFDPLPLGRPLADEQHVLLAGLGFRPAGS